MSKKRPTLSDLILEKFGNMSAFARKLNPKKPESARRAIMRWINRPQMMTITNMKTVAKHLKIDACELMDIDGK